VAAAIALTVLDDRAAGRIYNVGEELTLTTEERVRLLAQITGWNGQIVKLPRASIPKYLRDTYNYSRDLAYDTNRIRRELGYRESLSVEEAIRRTIDDLRAQPPAFDTADYDYAAEDDALTAAHTAAPQRK
jgi:nucleoside-diphosphate-sugar epimerase